MSSNDMVKLTDGNIRRMVKRGSSGNFTIEQASRTYGITERRVQQLTKIVDAREEMFSEEEAKKKGFYYRML